jgi:DNA modification methylase
MTRELWDIEKLFNWDRNPRSITDDKFETLKRRITKYGQFKPVIITKDGEVIGGNMRLRAMRDLGIKQVWVSVVEPGSDAEKVEIALADNEEVGFYDHVKLAELAQEYKNEIDLNDFSISIGRDLDLNTLLTRYAPDNEIQDDIPGVTKDAVSKPGEIYMLGNHRLMCGSATVLDDVQYLLSDTKADLIFTDPPYNVDYTGKTKDALKIQNDVFESNNFQDFLYEAFTNMYVSSKAGASYYICHSDSEGLNFRNALNRAGYLVKQCIIWNKNSIVMGRQDYHWKHEPILYGWKEGASHMWYGDRKQSTVWDIDRPTKSTEHPTMKPIHLIERALNNSSKAGDIVLDLFAGSGSTIIACEKLQRVCYAMEIDPHYCDVIRKRYFQYIGKGDLWQESTTVLKKKQSETK